MTATCAMPKPGATMSALSPLAPKPGRDLHAGEIRHTGHRQGRPARRRDVRTSRWRTPAEMLAGIGFNRRRSRQPATSRCGNRCPRWGPPSTARTRTSKRRSTRLVWMAGRRRRIHGSACCGSAGFTGRSLVALCRTAPGITGANRLARPRASERASSRDVAAAGRDLRYSPQRSLALATAVDLLDAVHAAALAAAEALPATGLEVAEPAAGARRQGEWCVAHRSGAVPLVPSFAEEA